jgi:hypothetical protein
MEPKGFRLIPAESGGKLEFWFRKGGNNIVVFKLFLLTTNPGGLSRKA